MTTDLVCIDTQILIWGVRRPSEPSISSDQEYMLPKAEAFLEWLVKTKKRVMIPSVTLAEWLIPVPPDMYLETIAKLSKGFQIRPFDVLAAAKYAELWKSRHTDGTYQALQAKGLTGKQIDADCMIVATAIACKAECIYSDDHGVNRCAAGSIKCSEMPDVYNQLQMFNHEPSQEPTALE